LKNTKFFGVFKMGKDLYTRNLVAGKAVYGERLYDDGGVEYRRWNPRRSKLSSAIHSRLRTCAFNKECNVLYLGAATGTTVSHLSDIVVDGLLYAVEFSPSVFRKLSTLSLERTNIIPILEDASLPGRYSAMVNGRVDIIWQDISQKDQVEILIKNVDMYLKDGGTVYLVLKARSISATKPVKKIKKHVTSSLLKHFKIIEAIDISRYQMDHTVYVLKTL